MSSVSPPPLTDLLGGNAGTSTETTPSEYIPPIPHHTASSSSSSFGNLSPSILIIILILTVTLVASVSLCFLLRHLNRRCLRHLSAAPAASSASSASSSSAALSSRRVSPETPADSLLESLPLFAFSSITRPRSDAAADCAVCLSKFEPDDQLRLLPLCCHAFHALCVDTWLRSNQTCPLCRSPIVASEAEILKTLGRGGDSFRIEIGNVSRRETTPFGGAGGESRRSYSIGSFDYLVEDDSEVVVFGTASSELKDFENVRREIFPPATATEASLAADVASSGRSWLKDYVDRLSTSLSSRAASFRSSGRFFSGSSRRSDVVLGVGEWDLEASRVGEEISELFRWVSGV